jgi:hypothetical protein
MYGIKLIHPEHLKYDFLTQDFDGTDGRRTLMNFSGDGKSCAIAANIPVGHRALVYVTELHKFIWAIEYVGTLEDGKRAAGAHKIPPDTFTNKWNIYLPVRIVARVGLEAAPTADELCGRTGVSFAPNQFTMKYVTAAEYRTLFEAIPWERTSQPSSER